MPKSSHSEPVSATPGQETQALGHTRLSPCLLPRSPPSLSLVDCFFLVGFSMKSLPEIFEEMHTYY